MLYKMNKITENKEGLLAGLCEVCNLPSENLKIDCGRYKCDLCRSGVEGGTYEN